MQNGQRCGQKNADREFERTKKMFWAKRPWANYPKAQNFPVSTRKHPQHDRRRRDTDDAVTRHDDDATDTEGHVEQDESVGEGATNGQESGGRSVKARQRGNDHTLLTVHCHPSP